MAEPRRKRAAVVVQALRGLELPAQFLFALIAARTMGAEQYGLVGVLVAVQAIALVLSTYGYDELLQRSSARDPRGTSDYLRSSLQARTTAAALVAGGGVVASAIVALANRNSIWVAIALLTAALIFNLYSGPLLSVGLSTYRPTVPVAASLLSWVIPVVLAVSGVVNDAPAYCAALLAGAVVRFVISVAWGTRNFGAGTIWRGIVAMPLTAPRLDTQRAHFSLMLYGLNNQVLARHGDIVVAGVVGLSLALIGTYSMAFQVAATANSFLMIGLGAIGLSRLSERSHDPGLLARSWRRLSSLAALLAVGPLSVLALIAPEIGTLVLGDSLPDFVPVLWVLIVSQWIARIAGGGTNIGALIALGDTSYVARSSLIGSGLNIVLNFALIPWLGVYGMALATAIAALTVGVSNAIRIFRRLAVLPPLTWLFILSIVLVSSVLIAAFGRVDILGRLFVSLGVVVIWGLALSREVRR